MMMRFDSRTASPTIPSSNPLITFPAPTGSMLRFVHWGRQPKDTAFGYETLSSATRMYDVSNTRPLS